MNASYDYKDDGGMGGFGLKVTWGRIVAKMMAAIKQMFPHSQFQAKGF